ncbi:hypothetical protein GCM10010341_62160 [Streptomyces noursei]|nr:hypothetical protein GCM10010341_62160 [Streptomyces noursei]
MENVASPTPIVLIRLDSMTVTLTLSPSAARKYEAVIQPDVPPPTITTLESTRIPPGMVVTGGKYVELALSFQQAATE